MLLIPKNRWVQVELSFDETEEVYAIVVPTHVIHEIEIRKNRFYLVERSHIMAVLTATE